MTVAVQKAPAPLHVALPGRLAEEVRRLAEMRGDMPQTFVAAAIQRLVEDEARLTEVLGEEPAARTAPGQGRRPLDSFPAGLTQRQCGVLYVLGFHADEDGVFRKQLIKIGLILNGMEMPSIGNVLAALRDKGLISEVPGKGGRRQFQLTRSGHRVFKELSDEEGA